MIRRSGRLILDLNINNKLLEINNVTISYGPIVVLNNVNLEIRKGEIIALFGPNGAGKSTLLKSVMGLTKLSEGSIVYQGENIDSLKPETINRLGIQLIPEDRGIFKTLTVEENLKLGAYYSYRQYHEQLEMIIELFPIVQQRLKQLAGTLSGGEQKILSFAKTLMSKSQLLMIDEPSLGLSPKYIKIILETIQELNQHGYTILLAEQNVKQSISYAERIYILEGGQIVLHGTADEVKGHPEIKEAYFGVDIKTGRR